MIKIDLHTHTNRYSLCSVLSPEALCEVAIRRGLDAIAITEHHHQWSGEEIAELQAGYPSLKLYAGVEISCADKHDYVVLGLESDSYSPHPMPYQQFRSLLNARPGAFVCLAHCFRHSTDVTGLEERPVDGIEMGSYNVLARPQPESGPAAIRDAELYRTWQDRMGWIALYNSDGHSERMVGTFYNLVETANGMPSDEDALIRTLRQAQIRGFQDDALIRASVNHRW